MRQMSGLSAGPPCGLFFDDRFGCPKGIGGRRQRRIAAMGTQSRRQVADQALQLGNALLQGGDACVAFPTARTKRRFHPDKVST